MARLIAIITVALFLSGCTVVKPLDHAALKAQAAPVANKLDSSS